MACNCGRKSAAQKYNYTTQALTATPAPLNMGASAGLPSGPSIVDRGNNLGVGRTGLYRITAQAILAVTTAGTVNLQAYYDGVPITAARKSRPAVVGSTEITLDNLVYMVVPDSCGCNDVTLQVDVYAWTDDSAAATVSSLTVNLIKEA